jgi:hypothetical protein
MNKIIKRSINVDTKFHLDCEISQYGTWHVKKRLIKTLSKKQLPFSPDELNDFFSLVSNEPVTVPSPSKPPSIKFDCSFRFSQVSKKDIVDAYRCMKKGYKTTPDVTGFSPIMLSHTIFCPSVS